MQTLGTKCPNASNGLGRRGQIKLSAFRYFIHLPFNSSLHKKNIENTVNFTFALPKIKLEARENKSSSLIYPIS